MLVIQYLPEEDTNCLDLILVTELTPCDIECSSTDINIVYFKDNRLCPSALFTYLSLNFSVRDPSKFTGSDNSIHIEASLLAYRACRSPP